MRLVAARAPLAKRTLFALAIVLGLAARLVFLHRPGVDVVTFAQYGHAVVTKGLWSGYQGNYYPLSWGVFGGVYRISQLTGLGFVEVEKLATLVFDLGNLCLLVVLLRRWRLSAAWALFYWLGPYFIVIDWNGYADPQVTFFVLGTLALLSDDPNPRRSLAAGVSFAAALLMKPHVLVLGVMLVAYACVQAVLQRRWDTRCSSAVALLVAPVIALLCASIAFALGGRDVTFVVHTYLSPPKTNYAISVYFPNVWFPIKALLTLHLNTGFIIRRPLFLYGVALVAQVSLALWALVAIARHSAGWKWSKTVLVLFVVGAVTQPMVFFAAYENHFFLAAVLGPLLCLVVRSKAAFAYLMVALVLQAVNILGAFGLGGSARRAPQPILWLVEHYTSGVLVVLAMVNVAVIVLAAVAVTRHLRRTPVVVRLASA